jgi:inosine-uridine nucleoside N-ribohydrolase
MLSLFILLLPLPNLVPVAVPKAATSKIIFDTDIGDDIDDAYALGFLLRSPEIEILGVTTAFGDTHLRARLATRFLKAAGRGEVPVFEGPKTPQKSTFSQRKWAEGSPDRTYPDAVGFMLDTIRKYPGQVTLVSVATLTTVGALIEKYPKTFLKLKRVVIMGGSVEHGYGTKEQPDVEWNIQNDVAAAKALFASGVPLYVMPLDSTQIPLEPAQQSELFGKNTGMTNALKVLTEEWSAATNRKSPILFDPVAAAYAVKAEICPTTAMRIEVDSKGYTRRVDGTPNANVCLQSRPSLFFNIFMPRSF